MRWIALKMLVGDRAKYFGIVAGITFAALLIAQQLSIFCGLLLRTTSQLQDIAEADVWVMDPNVDYIDELKPMKEDYLQRVQGVPGVAWAVHFYKGQARLKLGNGKYQQAIVLGLDDATMVGAPTKIVLGSLADLRQPDAVIMDEEGYHYLWPRQPLRTGRLLEMNDHRAVLVGICRASRTFQTFPVLYTRYSLALQFIPQERRVMPFVLAAVKPGASAKRVCARIRQQTGLIAITRDDFAWKTISYYLKRTGIPINFGITVGLGFIVGCAIAGQTFYTFVLENQNQFGALKAMGVSNRRIVGMVLIQALVVGLIGYSLGVGLATLFGVATHNTEISFYMPWQILVGTAVSVGFIVAIASLISIYRVLVLEPAVVFRN
ncbi:MAG TPA: ABC transporter permease [Pirellulales bacterium]|jgi:putative ABC transport system permease protein|nr:ABC transporter permease [Pirellulales bacterium]